MIKNSLDLNSQEETKESVARWLETTSRRGATMYEKESNKRKTKQEMTYLYQKVGCFPFAFLQLGQANRQLPRILVVARNPMLFMWNAPDPEPPMMTKDEKGTRIRAEQNLTRTEHHPMVCYTQKYKVVERRGIY